MLSLCGFLNLKMGDSLRGVSFEWRRIVEMRENIVLYISSWQKSGEKGRK